jgi:hypothetical protein
VAEDIPHRYCVYGITILSEIPLALPTQGHGDLARIELRTAPPAYFADATRNVPLEQVDGSWYQFARLPDRSSYARWEGVGEFLVSADGGRITCRPLDPATTESFQVYLLGQALSFALVKRGFEPLHATTVVVRGGAVVFLGESGFGKSTLAACFLAAGHRMLTDDLLMLRHTARGVIAYPGPPRIKLLPKMARKYMEQTAAGVRMNPDTEKLILPLEPSRRCHGPVPVKAIYALASPDKTSQKQGITIEPLSSRDGFLKLIENTFNYRLVDPARLGRQFTENTRLANTTPVRMLSYPRVLSRLPQVREAILRDLNADSAEAACGN